MIASNDSSRENLTLTEAELAACHPIAGEGGHVLRALCPFHGSDHQRSLRVTLASGRFVCFACGAWGYLAEARQRWGEEQQRQGALRRPAARPPRRPPAPRVARPPVRRPARTRRAPAAARLELSAAARRLPGRPAGEPRRGVPAPARHPPGASAAAGRGLRGAGHLAACGPRLARRPRGRSAYHARGPPDKPLRPRSGHCRAGTEDEAA